MRRIAVLLIALFATPLLAAPTRLPQAVIPTHYAIRITPDLANETFSGTETIDVDVSDVDSITLHSVDLTLKDVEVVQKLETTGGGSNTSGVAGMTATVTADPENETVTLKLPQPLRSGRPTSI